MTIQLLFFTGSLGDSLIVMPLIRAIREIQSPDDQLWMICTGSSATGSVLPHEVIAPSGLVDQFLYFRANAGIAEKLRTIWRVFIQIRGHVLNHAYYIGGSASATRTIVAVKLFCRLCGCRQLHGFRVIGRNRRWYMLNKEETREVFVRAENLDSPDIAALTKKYASRPFFPISSQVAAKAERFWNSHSELSGRRVIGVGMGSNQPAKVWPISRFEDAIETLSRNTRCAFLLFGGQSDKADIERLCQACNNCIDVCSLESIEFTAAILQRCEAYLGIDSGLMHLAASVGTRCVIVFSAHNIEGLWHPLGNGHKVIRRRVPCENCQLRTCPVEGHPCMRGIHVDEAITAVKSILAENDTRSTEKKY